ncbi:hypothetical protein Pint_35407 [Pistacia integerrima]|uniref:Uncharacterized protein n=1 Tax=Pistacia integerrima TaxID=434235 RepID=A0ACC0Y0H8_9ROSI|nr:hypothetical protein Pint_35407 [Pistacia integerrima]
MTCRIEFYEFVTSINSCYGPLFWWDLFFLFVLLMSGNYDLTSIICVSITVFGSGLMYLDWKRKQVYYYGKPCYTRQRSQRISPFKRRKLFDQIPTSRYGEFQREGIYNSPYKRSNGDKRFAAKGASPSVASQQAPPKSKSRDSIVKLHIKSFKIPELFIEIPATATVGSLKRTVMEAATAILGDDLHVGILLQGKTVRDDSKTLLQTGICHDGRHCNLGFMLEPKSAQIMPPLHTDDSRLLSSGMPQDPTGHSVSLTPQPEPSDVSPLPPVMNMGCHVDNNVNAVCSLADISTNNTMPDSQALVAVPAITMEALAVVPFHQKSRHSEFLQRRTRRPFSVSEVEALVQAVEKLGTGRWRDVKLRAFDNAKHRTYVDLKDKWKTLVHTARISPQQRRGEPLPQQLLDRVLAAHAYWSQHQAYQQLKIPV